MFQYIYIFFNSCSSAKYWPILKNYCIHQRLFILAFGGCINLNKKRPLRLVLRSWVTYLSYGLAILKAKTRASSKHQNHYFGNGCLNGPELLKCNVCTWWNQKMRKRVVYYCLFGVIVDVCMSLLFYSMSVKNAHTLKLLLWSYLCI